MLLSLVDFLFPKICVFCDTQGSYICEECKIQKIEFYNTQLCHVCHRTVTEHLVHKNCLDKTNINGVIVVAHYNKFAKILIEEMKYNLYYSVSNEIGSLMRAEVLKNELNYDAVVPIPLHRFKENYRGFNQANLLAKQIPGKVDNCLRRTKNTKSQVNLNREERMNNLKDIFRLRHDISYESVLLVDDVMTSGSTLEECSKVLKESGVEKVFGIVFARG